MKYIDADLLRKEIERRITDNTFGAKLELIDILAWLDTLSEEPDKSLVEEIETWIPAHISGGDDEVWKDTKNIVIEWAGIVARHFAEWGAEHLRDSTKKINKSLEEAAEEYTQQMLESWRFDSTGCRPPRESFIAGAEWQASQMPMPEDTVLFNKGVAEGRRLEREDMLKDAYVESQIVEDGRIELGGNPLPCLNPIILLPYPQFKLYDKVRIIIVKEDSHE